MQSLHGSRQWPALACVAFPDTSSIGEMIGKADFRESYRIYIRNSELSVIDIFLEIFGNKPAWMKPIFGLRNAIVKPLGLTIPSTEEVFEEKHPSTYKVGETILAWPIFFLMERELVAGRNNVHLDFRVSVLKDKIGDRHCAIVSTVCVVHNLGGDLYLKAILPFHKLGLRWLIRRALSRGVL